MTLTKADLVATLIENCSFSRKEAVDHVERVFEIIKEALENGEKVKISGFGNFTIREKRPRKGRNPQTGGEMVITGRRVLTFKPSAILRKLLNQEKPTAESIKFQ
jgi:integration host factor subunit alpha